MDTEGATGGRVNDTKVAVLDTEGALMNINVMSDGVIPTPSAPSGLWVFQLAPLPTRASRYAVGLFHAFASDLAHIVCLRR